MYTFTLVLRQTHQWTLRLIVTLVKFQAHFARLSGRIRDNPKLTIRTTLAVYRACVFSTLLYGSKTWTLLTMQEKKVNTFHQRFLRHIFRIRWQHKITNEEVLRRTGLTTMYTTLSHRRFGHVLIMRDERISNNLLYSELVVGKRIVARPRLRYKDICKHDLKSFRNVNIDQWEKITDDRNKWRSLIRKTAWKGKSIFKETKEEGTKTNFIFLAVITVCCLCIDVYIKSCGHSMYGRFRLIVDLYY